MDLFIYFKKPEALEHVAFCLAHSPTYQFPNQAAKSVIAPVLACCRLPYSGSGGALNSKTTLAKQTQRVHQLWFDTCCGYANGMQMNPTTRSQNMLIARGRYDFTSRLYSALRSELFISATQKQPQKEDWKPVCRRED